jgi:hypothetical protein
LNQNANRAFGSLSGALCCACATALKFAKAMSVMSRVVLAGLFWLYFAFPAQVVASPSPAAHIDFSPEQTTASPQPGGLQPLTPAQIARRAFPSVVLLSMHDARGQPISLGSGFFIDKDVVATNFHVIDQAAGGYAKVIGQTAKLSIKGIIGLDVLHDLGYSSSIHRQRHFCALHRSLQSTWATRCMRLEIRAGLEGTFSQGLVSSVRQLGSDRILQITAPFRQGAAVARAGSNRERHRRGFCQHRERPESQFRNSV